MDHDLAAHLAVTDHHDIADLHQQVEQITGWHALHGLPIGLLRGLAPGTDLEVAIEEVLDETSDLAVADRVAWVRSQRTGSTHVVLAGTTGYLVASLNVQLDWAAAMRMQAHPHAPHIVSTANHEGVLPVLKLVGA